MSRVFRFIALLSCAVSELAFGSLTGPAIPRPASSAATESLAPTAAAMHYPAPVVPIRSRGELGSDTVAVKSCTPRNTVAYLVRFLPVSGQWDITPPTRRRVSNRDRVEVCIEHFNFMRYTLSFDVSEERSEAYDFLTKLWTSILSPSFGDILGALAGPQKNTEEPTLLRRLQILYTLSTDLDQAIGEELARYKATGLSHEEATKLAEARGSIVSKTKVLTNSYTDLQEYLLDPEHTDEFGAALGGKSRAYHVVTTLYQSVAKRADLFVQMAGKTIGIEVRKVGTRSPGTKVTLKIAAIDEGGNATSLGDVHYLVETKLPLLLHAGLAFSGLHDVTFEKVKRAAGASEEDLFAEKSSNDNSTSLTAFLAAQLLSLGAKGESGDAPFALLFSLGTDVRSPGKKVYAGPSIALFNRAVLSVGLVVGKESKGEQETLEPNVFRIIRDDPETTYFLSFSIRVH